MSDQDLPQGSTGETLTQRTVNAAQWVLATVAVNAVVQFIVGIVLARLIPPEDFGLLALAMLFVGLAGLFSNLGIAPSVIQRSVLTDAHIRVAFTLSVLLGGAIAVVLFLSAPLSTWVFDAPGLPRVIRVLSLTFVISGIGATAGALMRRALDFKTNFFLSLASYLGGYALVGTVMAVQGFGVWSLVGATLATGVIQTGILLAVIRHPLRPLLRKREAKDLTAFGIGFSLDSIMRYIARTGDNLVVGRWLGTQQLGFYTRAYGLSMLPHDFIGQTANSVLFPAMSGVQSEPDRIRRAYYTAVQLATTLSLPVLAGMAVAAPHMIIGLYGERWAGAILPLQLLTALGAFSLVSGLGATVVNALGRPYSVMLRTLVYAALVLGLGVWGTRWGTPGVAIGVGIASAFMYAAISHLALSVTDGTYRRFVAAHIPAIPLAIAVLLVAALARAGLVAVGASHLVVFGILVPVCGATALLTFRLFPRSMREEVLRHVTGTYRDRLPKRMATLIDKALLG